MSERLLVAADSTSEEQFWREAIAELITLTLTSSYAGPKSKLLGIAEVGLFCMPEALAVAQPTASENTTEIIQRNIKHL